MKEKTRVALYTPKISLGATNKYDVYLTIEWGFFKKTTKLSKEVPNITNRVVEEINLALKSAVDSQPYEIK